MELIKDPESIKFYIASVYKIILADNNSKKITAGGSACTTDFQKVAGTVSLPATGVGKQVKNILISNHGKTAASTVMEPGSSQNYSQIHVNTADSLATASAVNYVTTNLRNLLFPMKKKRFLMFMRKHKENTMTTLKAYPERDLMWEFESFPKKVIDMVTETCKSLLVDATDKDSFSAYGEYSRTICVRQKVEDTVAVADITIQFKHIADCSTDKGYNVICKGSVTDGNKTYESEWEETPPNLLGMGDYKDLVDLVENYNPTDFTYNTIEEFFEYLRDNLSVIEKGIVA